MARKLLAAAAAVSATFACAADTAPSTIPAGIKSALESEHIGFLPGDSFHLRTGKCTDCKVPKQSLWYFENEFIAVPGARSTVSGFTPAVDRKSDVSKWAATAPAGQLNHPAVVWLGAPNILEGAVMQPGAQRVRTSDGKELDLKLVPKLSTNLSYANDKTAAWLSGREVRIRGTLDSANGKDVFVARTIWPSDFAFAPATMQSKPLQTPADLEAYVREPIKDARGVETRLIWERKPGQSRLEAKARTRVHPERRPGRRRRIARRSLRRGHRPHRRQGRMVELGRQ